MTEKRDLPPGSRGIAAQRLSFAAAQGRFELPVCEDCGALQYPPRERCLHCLSDRLPWREVAPEGSLLARTSIHHTNEPYFRPRLPIEIASVRLDAGAVVIVFLEGARLEAGARVRVQARLDVTGQAVLVAAAADAEA